MNRFLAMLAQFDDDGLPAPSRFVGSQFFEILLVLGAMTVVAIIAAIWAIRYSNRRSGHKHHRRHRRKPGQISPGAGANPQSRDESSKRKKWKEVRRPHRPMNPTLAQTRGLPPVRDPNSAPPFP